MKVLESVRPADLPADALFRRHKDGGAFADCFVTRVDVEIGHADFVAAFYTTWLFKIERAILTLAVSKPSSDADAVELGLGTRDHFAAWRVEERAPDQLLLCDFSGHTRSWLMTATDNSEGTVSTLLYFGSAVVPRVDPATGQASMGTGFRLLLGVHTVYSRLLLRAACARLQARRHGN